ncbi:MAG: chitobiase/beta-hexosaminidase C-terminal domain-containing protein [Verrucomicrobiales bacterium]
MAPARRATCSTSPPSSGCSPCGKTCSPSTGQNAAADDGGTVLPQLSGTGIRLDPPPRYFLSPTPGAANGMDGISNPAARVTISPDGSTFAEMRRRVSTEAEPLGTIRYTLDGSDPTAASPEYTGLVRPHHAARKSARGSFIPANPAGGSARRASPRSARISRRSNHPCQS